MCSSLHLLHPCVPSSLCSTYQMMHCTNLWSDTNGCFAGVRPTGKWEGWKIPERPPPTRKWEEGNVPERPRPAGKWDEGNVPERPRPTRKWDEGNVPERPRPTRKREEGGTEIHHAALEEGDIPGCYKGIEADDVYVYKLPDDRMDSVPLYAYTLHDDRMGSVPINYRCQCHLLTSTVTVVLLSVSISVLFTTT